MTSNCKVYVACRGKNLAPSAQHDCGTSLGIMFAQHSLFFRDFGSINTCAKILSSLYAAPLTFEQRLLQDVLHPTRPAVDTEGRGTWRPRNPTFIQMQMLSCSTHNSAFCRGRGLPKVQSRSLPKAFPLKDAALAGIACPSRGAKKAPQTSGRPNRTVKEDDPRFRLSGFPLVNCQPGASLNQHLHATEGGDHLRRVWKIRQISCLRQGAHDLGGNADEIYIFLPYNELFMSYKTRAVDNHGVREGRSDSRAKPVHL